MNTLELRQTRQRHLDRAQEMLNRAERERRNLSASESDLFKYLMNEADMLAETIDREESRGGFGRRDMLPVPDGGARPAAPESDALTFRTLDGREVRALRADESLAANIPPELRNEEFTAGDLSLGRMVRGLVTGEWKGAEAERRAMSVGTDVLGGYLVPSELSARVIDLARNQARVLQAGALTIPMSTAELTLARITGDPTAGWKAEHAAAVVSDMSFDAIHLRARTLMGIVKLSIELVEDAPNVDRIVEQALAASLALEMDRAALRGTGADEQPRGIRFSEGVQLVPVDGALAGYDLFSSAIEKIARVNGPTDGLAAIYSPRTWGEIDRLKDSQGRPLTPPASFERLRKFTTNQVPEDLGQDEDETEITVGNFRELLWGVRTGLRLEISREAADSQSSAFRDGQVWIRAYLRGDVALARPNQFVVLTGVQPEAD